MNSYFVFFKSDDTLSRWLLLYMPLDPGSVADTKLYYGVRSVICSGTFNDAHYFVCLQIRGKEEIPRK